MGAAVWVGRGTAVAIAVAVGDGVAVGRGTAVWVAVGAAGGGLGVQAARVSKVSRIGSRYLGMGRL